MNIIQRIFGRKPVQVAPLAPRFIEVRSYSGTAFHFLDTQVERVNGVQPAMCGYARWVPTNSVLEVTEEKVRAALPHQHKSWHYCKDCVNALFAKSNA